MSSWDFQDINKSSSYGSLSVRFNVFGAEANDDFHVYPQFSEEMVGFAVTGRDEETDLIVRVSIFVDPHDGVDETAELKMAVYTRDS